MEDRNIMDTAVKSGIFCGIVCCIFLMFSCGLHHLDCSSSEWIDLKTKAEIEAKPKIRLLNGYYVIKLGDKKYAYNPKQSSYWINIETGSKVFEQDSARKLTDIKDKYQLNQAIYGSTIKVNK